MFMFGKSDIGCHVDGTFGVDHAMEKVYTMLLSFNSNCEDLLKEYDEYKKNVDTWEHVPEWLDDATGKLQERTEGHLEWVWEGGDLLLVEESYFFESDNDRAESDIAELKAMKEHKVS